MGTWKGGGREAWMEIGREGMREAGGGRKKNRKDGKSYYMG